MQSRSDPISGRWHCWSPNRSRMFTAKIQRQLSRSTRTPPSTGPTTNAVPVRRPDTDGASLFGAGEPRIDHRQGTRYQERRADALQAAGGDQKSTQGSHRAHQRRAAEHDEPHPQHRQPSEAIRYRARNQDQRAEREQVAVDPPLLQTQSGLSRRREFPGNRGQRKVHHRPVQERHERGQHRDRDERPIGTLRSQSTWRPASVRDSISAAASVFTSARLCSWIARCAALMAR